MEIEANYFKTMTEFLDSSLAKKYVLLVASKTKIELEKSNKFEVEFCGGIFPQIIYNNSVYDEGLIAIKINDNMKTIFLDDMNNTTVLRNEDFSNTKSILTILEGFSNDKEFFLQELFQLININTAMIGGGAGDLVNDKKAVIFDNKRFYKNSAIIVTMDNDITLSVKHGWEYLDGPFIVTSSEHNLLNKIDYKDALDVYKEVIKKDCGITINENNFSEISKSYPIGIIKYRKEQVVRDPIAYKNKSLVLIGKISNNSIINILKGKNETLLEASRKAATEVLVNECKLVMMFDCITRKNFLEEKFDEELDTIYKKSTANTFIGAITIGEVANEGNKYINFLNKTCVIGGICF